MWGKMFSHTLLHYNKHLCKLVSHRVSIQNLGTNFKICLKNTWIWELWLYVWVFIVSQVKLTQPNISSTSFMSVSHRTSHIKLKAVSLLLPCDLKVLCSETGVAQYIMEKRQWVRRMFQRVFGPAVNEWLEHSFFCEWCFKCCMINTG